MNLQLNKKSYIMAGVGIALIAVVLLFGLDRAPTSVNMADAQQAAAGDVVEETDAQSVYADGVIIKDEPLLKPGVWYVGIEHEGRHLAVELKFDENSICVGRTASGTCVPDYFIEDRAVHVEGVVDGDTMRVLEMTFTKALK